MNLRDTVDLINSWHRAKTDPNLLEIQLCTICNEEFPSLSADISLRKVKNIEPKCRICARENRKKRGSEMQRERRKKLKES
jgi:hypothetical protein